MSLMAPRMCVQAEYYSGRHENSPDEVAAYERSVLTRK